MRELSAENASAYLIDRGHASRGEPLAVRELAGGVSNLVLLVELRQRGERFVLKQARGKLRVQEEWLCAIERIWREVEVVRICGELAGIQNSEFRMRNAGLVETCVPEVLWEDRENYCYAMTAAPLEHRTWKELLLAGDLAKGNEIAAACGRMLAAIHAGSWGNSEVAAQLDDRTYFDQLRIDPYYRHVAKVHPDLGPQIQQLIDSVWSHRLCLVHGDFSPKNLLVWEGWHHVPRDAVVSRSETTTKGTIMLIDCEVGHYGDPAFDLGFFLTHLVLKAIRAWDTRALHLDILDRFWTTYRSGLSRVAPAELSDLERRAVLNLAGCTLARIDGKSPVDYLTSAKRETVRVLARRWLADPPLSVGQALHHLGTSAPTASNP